MVNLKLKDSIKKFKNIEYYETSDYNICRYNPLLNIILISSNYFKKFNENEIYFILLHENGHKRYRIIYIFLWLYFLNIFIITLLLILNFILNMNSYIILLTIFFPIISLYILCYIYRFLEYRADEYAANNIDFKFVKSTMEKISKEKNSLLLTFFGKLTHPKIGRRIKYLRKIREKKQ